MSKINDLLESLAPSGVEFRPLGELVDNLDRQRRPVTRASREAGNYPYYGANGIQDYVAEYIFDGTYLLVGEDGSVTRRDGTPVLNWATGKIWVNNHAHVLSAKSPAVDLRFLYHYLQTVDITNYVTGTAQPKLNQGNLNRIPVPVPPIQVQAYLVQVLDTLSSSVDDLESNLRTESQSRQQQFGFYRDNLFTFDEATVPSKPMGEVGEFIRGRRFTKNDVVEDGIPSIHYGEIYTTYGIATKEAASHVRENLRSQLRFAKPGDVVIAAVGETVEDVGSGVAWLGTTDVAIHDDCFLYRSEVIDPKFLCYYLQTTAHNKAKAMHVARAKVKRMSKDGLARLLIPLPPLDEQRKVVAILDELHSLTSDLVALLPAEINARQQQYQFYRSNLLAFEELSA